MKIELRKYLELTERICVKTFDRQLKLNLEGKFLP